MAIQKKILVVDDEKPLSEALRLKLTHSGFEVKTAGNGEEALKLLEKEDFDLVLMDLVMPQMDGFQVLEKLAEKKPKAKVIVTSNLSQEEDFTRAQNLGAVKYFVKSDTPLSEIVHNIETTLQ